MEQILSLGMMRVSPWYQHKKKPVVKNATAWQENWVSGGGQVSLFRSVP